MNLSAPFVRRPIAHGPADDRHRAGRHRRVLRAAGVAAAAGRLPDDLGQRQPARREPGDDGDQRRDAARAAAGRDRRRQRDDFEQRQRLAPASACSSTSNRNIDAAAREVQAAINASRADLPSTLRSNPTYRKANPSDAPVIILALTSQTTLAGPDLRRGVQHRAAAARAGAGRRRRRARRRLAAGGAGRAAAVRAEPLRRQQRGRARRAPGQQRQPAEGRDRGRRPAPADLHRHDTPARRSAADYRGLVVAWRDGAAVRLGDVAEVIDGVENINTLGLFNGEPAVIVLITRQPGANVIETVDGVRALLPELQAQLPDGHQAAGRLRPHPLDPRLAARGRDHAADLDRCWWCSSSAPSCAACARPSSRRSRPSVSLLGTFGVMYLLGFSLNNLSA